jgi:hypothetical protein
MPKLPAALILSGTTSNVIGLPAVPVPLVHVYENSPELVLKNNLCA